MFGKETLKKEGKVNEGQERRTELRKKRKEKKDGIGWKISKTAHLCLGTEKRGKNV